MRLLTVVLIFLLYGCQETKEVVSKRTSNNLITTCSFQNVSASLRTPKTINEVTDLINALPKPLSLPCFIDSLARPLKINLTLSKLSAQPAVGNDSPRVFLFIDDLVLSVVPEGKGAYLLELSQFYTDSNSLKAELEFPIRENITYQTGYDRINVNGMTTCRACHNNEQLDTSVTESNAYTSVALKPEASMNLANFESEVYKCDLQAELNYRCQMIYSIFKHGQLFEESFPSGTPKWIDTI